MKNWTGNKRSTFSTLGASSHSDYEREQNDFYATDPNTIDALFDVEDFSDFIFEPSAGDGHLSQRMKELGKNVWSADIVERKYKLDDVSNFLEYPYTDKSDWVSRDIITNPPYKYAQDFVEQSLRIIEPGYKVAMFLKLTFLEGQKRRKMFDKYPPQKVYVFSKRVQVARNGDPEMFKKSSAACYAWFVWQKGFNNKPQIEWI